jgi:hypothetical protein
LRGIRKDSRRLSFQRDPPDVTALLDALDSPGHCFEPNPALDPARAQA